MLWDFSKFADNTALLDEYGIALSYAGLKKESEAVAEVVGRRCLVFCLCRNEIGSILGYVGFINAGIVPLLLNSHMDSGLLRSLMDAYQPPYMWVPEEMASNFSEAETLCQAFHYVLLKLHYSTEYPLHEDLGLLLTTSGSTGSPKFVRQSYENILDNARAIADYLELDEKERPITTLPMNYTYGLSILHSHFLVGAEVLVTEKSMAQREFWNFFREAGASSFGGVPYTYEMLDRMRFMGMALPSLKTMTQAGGKLTPELHRKFAEWAGEHGKKFIVMYGQCEATARMGYLPAEKALEKYGSMGIAIPRGKFHLEDAEGRTITEPHVTGELVYEGRNVTMGYAECGADLAKGDERHGILATGDMAQFDEDGYYYIVGRKKRFLKIYGNRINLDELERLLKGSFPGLELACGGVDDHLCIFIVEEGMAEEVRSFTIEKTKLNPAAFRTVIIPEIPKNDAGKTLYKDLEKYY